MCVLFGFIKCVCVPVSMLDKCVCVCVCETIMVVKSDSGGF